MLDGTLTFNDVVGNMIGGFTYKYVDIACEMEGLHIVKPPSFLHNIDCFKCIDCDMHTRATLQGHALGIVTTTHARTCLDDQ